MDDTITSILLAPLSRNFGLLTIFIGIYSLLFNTAEAKRQNHKRNEVFARCGGWGFIVIGISILIYAKLS